jgi:hypothetical protein
MPPPVGRMPPPLNSDLADELARDLTAILDLALELLRSPETGLDLTRAHGIARSIESGLQRHLNTDRDIDSALYYAYDIARSIVDALDHDLGLARGRARRLVRAVRGTRTLVRVTARARGDAFYFGVFLSIVRTSERLWTAPRGKRVTPSACRLLAAVTRLLPAADRDRYAGEFGSELWEIANAGGRRWAQLAFATRVMMSAWRLRAELRALRRRSAAP